MSKLSCGLSIPGVDEKNGRYYKIIRNQWIKLSRIDEGVNALLKSLYDLDPLKPGNIKELIAVYRALGMDELKPATRKDYHNILTRLDHHFGHMHHANLKTSQCARFLEEAKKAGRGTRANREMAVLSSVFKFGLRHEYVEFNPCRGIGRNTERPKRRFVTDTEFLDGFEKSNEPFQDLISAGYLSGARQTDVITWKRTNITKKGIEYIQSKTRKPHVIEMTKALWFFVDRAMQRFPDAELIFLNTDGQPWTPSAINSQKRRLGLTWAFKDLRSKAQTDSPHSVLGHGAALEAVYRKQLRTRPVR